MNVELTALVGKFPKPGGDQKLSDADKRQIDEAVAAIAELGPKTIRELAGMLVDPSAGTDTQVRHAIHALANFGAAQKDEHARCSISLSLAAALNDDRPKEAKGFLIRQLQVCGGDEVAETLSQYLVDEQLCADACQAMLAIGVKSELFRQALNVAKGGRHRCTIIQALGTIRDVEAAPKLREAALDTDSDIRQTSVWALANLGLEADVERLIAAANAKGYERIQATKACLLLAERLLATGNAKAAGRIYEHLRDTRAASEAYVRDTAARALDATKPVELFNGKDFAGWQDAAGKPAIAWTIEGDAMTRKTPSGDIWTTERFGDFILDLEFKTTGNSGIFIRTDNPKDCVQTGIEIQVDKPASKPGKHSCGAIYDCLAPVKELSKKDDWNHVIITAKGSKLAVKMNGEQIIDMDLDKWTEANTNPDGSKNKFQKALKDFGREGHLGFQDHGSPVMYRRIKLHRLNSF